MNSLLRPIAACLAITAITAPRPANAGWPFNGALASTTTYNTGPCAVAPDGYGGILIAWPEHTSTQWVPTDPFGAMFVQRIAADGTVVWGPTGVGLMSVHPYGEYVHVVADGEGGALVAWGDILTGSRARIQRVNFLGTPVWTAGGVGFGPALTLEVPHGMIPDGFGGAMVSFSDTRNGTPDLFVQKVDGTGALLWGTGVPVCTALGTQRWAQAIPDGEGGIILMWPDDRTDPDGDLYAQRVNFLGTVLWTANGVRTSTRAGLEITACFTTDGTSGLIAAWSNNNDIFAQRLNYAGAVQWDVNDEPIAVLMASAQRGVSIAPDDNGGAFIFWVDSRGGGSELYGVRVDAASNPHWIPGGILLSDPAMSLGGQTAAVRDETGGAIATYTVNGIGEGRVRALRVDDMGAVAWEEDAVHITESVRFHRVVGAGPGAAIVAWQDFRTGTQYQTYAMETPMIAAGVGDRTPQAGLRIVSVNPNPFSSGAEIQLEVERGGPLQVDVFDVAGHRVWSGRRLLSGPGGASVRIRARDDSGAALRSGVYFVRVSTAGATATRKVVVVR